MLMIIIMLSSLDTMLAVWSPVINAPFFPGLFFYVHIKSSNPKNPEGPTPQAPNPITWKPQLHKPDLGPYPQNHHKGAKVRQN